MRAKRILKFKKFTKQIATICNQILAFVPSCPASTDIVAKIQGVQQAWRDSNVIFFLKEQKISLYKYVKL